MSKLTITPPSCSEYMALRGFKGDPPLERGYSSLQCGLAKQGAGPWACGTLAIYFGGTPNS